jgi:thioesterase domain-containing protein/acyl carrier protein
MRQPGVTDAVVLLHDGVAGQEPCLVGYVVASSNASASAIRKALAERLPSYMVPTQILVLDSFPIASSGKVDRNALPPPHREEARPVVFREPSDDRERELLAIWRDVLKVPNIGVDDDFFELGGDSLQALTVFLEIEARLGCRLSPTTLVQAPTVARLTEFVRASKGIEASRSLVPLRASGTGLPLFLVSYFFDLGAYRHLLCALKTDRPVFGLQPPPLDGKHSIPRTIESMAAAYIIEMRRLQPRGPYFLAGYSFGGRVSFELAQQLVREGERVSFLGLIDTVLGRKPIEARPRVSEAAYLGRKVRGVRSLRELLFRGLRYLYSRNLVLDLRLRLGMSIPYEYRRTYYNWIRRPASRGYVLKPYPGHITILSSADNSQRQKEHWEPLARGGLTVLEVPVGHSEMVLPPYSKLLAEHFDACLDAAAVGE